MNPQPRIAVAGTFNFRDVGGYAASGGVVSSGKLYRSDALSKIGPAGKAELQQLGVHVVVDLRDDNEAATMPDDLAGTSIKEVRLPVFEGSGASQSIAGMSLEALYEKILNQHADVVVAALRTIATNREGAVLVHCTAGKDRTGIVIALALLAVGVSRDVVLADYARTESNLSGEWLDGMLAMVSQYGVPITPALRTLVGGSPPEALDGALHNIESKHGSVVQYLLDSGFTAHELEQLRASLVQPLGA